MSTSVSLFPGIKSLYLVTDTPYDAIETAKIRNDLCGIKVWWSSTPDFHPEDNEGVLAFDGLSSSITISGLENSKQYYVKYAFISSIDPDVYTILEPSPPSVTTYSENVTVYGYLTNPSSIIPTESDGSGGNFTVAGGQFKVYSSNSEVTGEGPVYGKLTESIIGGLQVTINQISGVYTVTGQSADYASAILTAEYGGVTVRTTLVVIKAKKGVDGTNAKLISISVTPGNNFIYANTTAVTSDTEAVTLKANFQNFQTNPLATWTAKAYDTNGSLLGNIAFTSDTATNSITISQAQFNPTNYSNNVKYAIVTAKYDTYSDTMTVYRLNNGADQLTLELTNENVSIPAYYDGTVVPSGYIAAGTYLKVYRGSTPLGYAPQTPPLNGQWAVSSAQGTHITPDTSPQVGATNIWYDTPSNMTTDAAYIDYTVLVKTLQGENVTLTKRQTFSKSIGGTPGFTATLVYLTTPELVFIKYKDGTYSSDYVTINADTQNIPDPKKYEWDDGSGTIVTKHSTSPGANQFIFNRPSTATGSYPVKVTVTCENTALNLNPASDTITILGLEEGSDAYNFLFKDPYIFLSANSLGMVESNVVSTTNHIIGAKGIALLTPGVDINYTIESTENCIATMGATTGTWNKQFTISGDIYSNASITNAKVVIRCSVPGTNTYFLQTCYITKVLKGATGENAKNVFLLQDSPTVFTDTNGQNYTLPAANQLFLYDGSVRVTAGATYTGNATKNGLTLAIENTGTNAGRITLTGSSWTSDSETFPLTVRYNNIDYNKSLIVTKSKQGVAGSTATLAFITTTELVFIKKKDGTYSSEYVTLSAYTQNISDPIFTWTAPDGSSIVKDSTSDPNAWKYIFNRPSTLGSYLIRVKVTSKSDPSLNEAQDAMSIAFIEEGSDAYTFAFKDPYTFLSANSAGVLEGNVTNSLNHIIGVKGSALQAAGSQITYTVDSVENCTAVIGSIVDTWNQQFTVEGAFFTIPSIRTAKVVIRATITGTSTYFLQTCYYTKQIKGDTGTNAYISKLLQDNVIVNTNANGTGYTLPSGNKMSVYSGNAEVTSGVTYKVSSTNTTTATQNGLTLAINGSTGEIALSGNAWSSNAETFPLTATLGTSTFSTALSVTKAKAGNDGTNAVSGYLTRETVSIATTSAGTGGVFTNAGGVFKVSNGTSDITGASNVTYSVVSQSNVTVSILSSGGYTVSTMPDSADIGTATFRAVYSGVTPSVTIDKTYTITKSKAGTNGTNGTSGVGPWTPIMTGGVVQDSTDSSRFYKATGNSGTWDAQVYSTQSFNNGAYVSWKNSNTSNGIMVGLNSDPATDASYGSLDFAWYAINGSLQIYESGAYKGTFGTYTADTLLMVLYNGSSVKYYKDGTVIYTTNSVGTNRTFYLDSAFLATGDRTTGINSVVFGTVGAPGLKSGTGYVYYSASQANNPGKPSAGSFTFSTGAFSGLTSGWSTSPPAATVSSSGSGTYWASRYVVNESDSGSDIGTPTFSDAITSQNFTGLVTFSNLVGALNDTNTSGTTTINGGRITTGTISVSKIITGEVAGQTGVQGGTNQFGFGTGSVVAGIATVGYFSTTDPGTLALGCLSTNNVAFIASTTSTTWAGGFGNRNGYGMFEVATANNRTQANFAGPNTAGNFQHRDTGYSVNLATNSYALQVNGPATMSSSLSVGSLTVNGVSITGASSGVQLTTGYSYGGFGLNLLPGDTGLYVYSSQFGTFESRIGYGTNGFWTTGSMYSSGPYYGGSSRRLKNNILPIDIGLEFILGLTPVKFDMKSTGNSRVGFVAEDFPDTRFVLSVPVDMNDLSKGTQIEALDYTTMVAPLVKAVQELNAKITELTAEIETLKAK